MIAHLLRLTRVEWYKGRRRWMPWILLGVVLLVAQAAVWGLYAAYHLSDDVPNESIAAYAYSSDSASFELMCADLLVDGRVDEKLSLLAGGERSTVGAEVEEWRETCDDYVSREEQRDIFTLPTSINTSVDLFAAFGLILLMILAASAIGVEYGWGTLRTTLARGTGRWQLLSAKLIALMLMGAAGLLVMAILTGVASILTGVLPPDQGGPLINSEAGTWLDAAAALGQMVYAMAPYVIVATCMTVLTQSTASGTALALVYYVADAFVLPPLLGITDWLEKVRPALLNENVSGWMGSDTVGSGVPPDTLQAFFVILAYTVVLGAVTFWLFQRRDIGGAKGG